MSAYEHETKELIYNPQSQQWEKINVRVNNTSADTSSSGGSSSGSASSKTSVGTVAKEDSEIQYNTLQGNLDFVANEDTIKIKAGDTVTLKGFGKYLSGDYYVQDIVKTISNNGYTHSATVIKTDVGEHLKSPTTENKVPEESKEVASTPSANSSERTYTVKAGDCLWKIAKQYYGDGKKYQDIYDANNNKIVNPNLIYVGQTLVIP